MSLPVLLVTLLAVKFGRKLAGSCGGIGADGMCTRCGKPAAEMPTEDRNSQSCP
ncbi:MAG: hypothetical protein ACYTG5_20315 [Planctomycetota bacterium]